VGPVGLEGAGRARLLRYSGKKRIHDADIFMSEHVAKRLVEHLLLSGFVILKKPLMEGHSGLSRGPKGDDRASG
jgi:hypothetical protein